MTEKEELEYLYQLYLINRCSAQELERFFELIKNSEDDEKIIQLLSATWDKTEATPETGLIPDFLTQKNTQPLAGRKLKVIYSFKRIIAAAAILFILGGIYLYRSDQFRNAISSHQIEVLSKTGERKQIQLEDGTKVWLSPDTKISYPKKFGSGKRMVILDGEAFFEVAHDAGHPFVIRTGAVSTTVLGTSFNVSAYQQQQDINVTLVTGKVAVALKTSNKSSEAVIVNNQRITVNKVDQKIIKTTFPDAGDFLERRIGLFTYKGIVLQEVFKDIELQYHIKIKVDEAAKGGEFFGRLDMRQPISQTLDKLSTVMEISWKKDGEQYVIIK